MIKLSDILKKDNTKDFQNLYECTIATIHIDGETILAKNRDRKYIPNVEIIHELIDNTELIYIHDKISDWSEGMNEYGTGIIKSSLSIESDERNSKEDKTKSYDGLKMREALSKKSLKNTIESMVTYTGKDKKSMGIKGMIMISNPKHSFIIENTSEHSPVFKKINNTKVSVRTNHGISFPDTGYTKGESRESSLSRMQIAKNELEKINNSDEILNTLSNQYTDNNFLNPYRRDNESGMKTTGQILMNLNKLEFSFRWDRNNSVFEGYKNNLPENYTPKIEVKIIEEIQ
jgi:hypothetical protein